MTVSARLATLAVVALVACSTKASRAPEARTEVVAPACTAPTGDVAAHLAAVRRAEQNPTKANIAALDNNEWTELWAVEARMGAEPADSDWLDGCRGGVGDERRWAQCFQQRWGGTEVALAAVDLGVLSCSVCRVGDLAPLGDHPALRELSLSDTYIEQPASLAALDNLAALSLQNTNVSGARHIAGLHELERLGLTGDLVSDLSGLERLIGLTDLSIGGDCLRELGPVAKLGQLQTLRLSARNLTDLEPLESLADLRVLHAFVPKASRPPRFAKMTKLETLFWRGAALTDLSELERLPRLREVMLSFHCVPPGEIKRLEKARPELDLHVGRASDRCR